MGLTYINAFEIFEYRKYNNNYYDRAKLYQQVIKKALFIPEITIFSRYLLLFLFHNTTSQSIYIKDIL